MKIRWTQNSVRFRISPSELDALRRGETVTEWLPFPAGAGWTAVIAPGPSVTELQGRGGEVTLRLSFSDLERLAQPDSEGVYFSQEGAAAIQYYVEKDFPCVHPRVTEAQEPETETFPPPEDFADRKAS
jgi:hypothetical protein